MFKTPLPGILCRTAAVLAVREYQEKLSRLYNDLNPEAFLNVMLPLCEIKTDTVTHTTTLMHIANGYLASGQWEKAQKVLQSVVLPDEAVELHGLVLSNLISCYIQKGDCGIALKTMNELKRLIHDKRCKSAFRKKACLALGYQTICLHVLQGKNADLSNLEKDLQSSRNPLHRVNVQFQLACIYFRLGDMDSFAKARDYILEHGRNLYMSILVSSLPDSMTAKGF